MHGVDVIVCNYKTPGDLQRFLDSYEESDSRNLWIVNVCPDREDTRVAVAYAKEREGVSVLEHHTNVGYARAVNNAAAFGSHDVIAIFNADTELWSGVVEECSEALMSDPDWGVLGPRQVDRRNRITHGGIIGTHSRPQLRAWRQVDEGQCSDVVEAVTVSGSAYFVKRSVWNELTDCHHFQSYGAEGAFLPTQHYYEETWCSYHAWAHGYKVIYWGPSVMLHEWHQSSPVGGQADQLWYKESKALFNEACERHGIPHD